MGEFHRKSLLHSTPHILGPGKKIWAMYNYNHGAVILEALPQQNQISLSVAYSIDLRKIPGVLHFDFRAQARPLSCSLPHPPWPSGRVPGYVRLSRALIVPPANFGFCLAFPGRPVRESSAQQGWEPNSGEAAPGGVELGTAPAAKRRPPQGPLGQTALARENALLVIRPTPICV